MIWSLVAGLEGPSLKEGLEPAASWIDLDKPTAAERAAVESALELTLPSRVRMRSIEPSNRLVVAQEYVAMTYSGASRCEDGSNERVTCILAPNYLITLRTAEDDAIATVRAYAERTPGAQPHDLFIVLVDATVGYLADRLEALGAEIDRISGDVFHPDPQDRRTRREVQEIMRNLGRIGTEILRLQDALTSNKRLVLFMEQHRRLIAPDLDDRNAINVLGSDIDAINQLANALDGKVDFLLNALLGLITLDQNQIMMVLSLIAAMFLPATLISSIFGMNFVDMPGLSWHHGFLLCVAGMVMAAISVWLIFHWRRWM
ncbi:CorA family divalent cation transporter [Acuticoccus sp. MNP-M23]|uniref:CorA family divalent cation transporter n=1 Tax=Acuticoccus sp. MNP-M23 TaxID=3072793 RepID=UPI002815A14F|nr:CorA family divalent cation transporter [Acuticoccus sp. MNP-M23]WMS43617.1 CorA family divalent cation transporter [Acuticoccus sp. MNP-M23]